MLFITPSAEAEQASEYFTRRTPRRCRVVTSSSRFLLVALAVLAAATAQVQQARRIAIHSFEDIGASRGAQIGQKLGDRLLNKLANSGAYQIVDRQFIDQVLKEQQMAQGRFDISTAVKVGKLANVSALVDGTITTFTQNPRSSEDSTGYYGTVTVSATARLISTETGAIVAAPAASKSAKGLLQIKPNQRVCRQVPFVGLRCTGPDPTRSDVETKTIEQLLDDALDACALSLANDIAAASSRVAVSYANPVEPNIAPPMSTPAKVIGTDDSNGMTFINRGAQSGMRAGLALTVYRLTDSGLTNPDDGKPLRRKTVICTLTLNDVDDRSSSGPCAGNPPATGDLAEIRVR